MILELGVGAALAVGVYNFFTNANFKAKVVSDFTALEAKVPTFVSSVKSLFGKVETAVKNDVTAVENDIKKL